MSKHWTPAISTLEAGIDGIKLDDVQPGTCAVATKLLQPKRARSEIPLVIPICHSSTYKISSVKHYEDILAEGGYIYSRLGNATCESAECAINALERGAGSMVFSSGMAAVSTALFGLLKSGDHVVACNPLYSGTHSVMKDYFPRFNIEVSWIPTGTSVEEYKKAMRPNTKILYGETPCNPLISVTDLEELAKLGQSQEGIVTVVDSTYGPPPIQQPITKGIDVVLHSATKYLGGHSDLVAGVVTTRTVELWKKLNNWRTTNGMVLSPFDASLLLRGIRTLDVRLERHCFNAQKIAEFLADHPKVSQVYYPGLPTDPGHEVAKKQMKAFGGMISFEMKEGLEAAKTLIQSVRVIQLAVSLGSVESLIEHPASMTHGPMIMSDEDRKAGFISDGLIRMSVGIENVSDLIQDLKQALDKA